MKNTEEAMAAEALARAARLAGRKLATASDNTKNDALRAIAQALCNRAAEIFAANARDMEAASQLAAPLRKRLHFDESKLAEAVEGIETLQTLANPVGLVRAARELDQGLNLFQVSCPIGVICMIFESRPDALIQIACLALKSGNAVVLKGGSEAANTNAVLAEIITEASLGLASGSDGGGASGGASGGGSDGKIPEGWLGLVQTRAAVAELLQLDQYIDLIIPRGSNEFVRHIMDNSRIPVMGHADGICHQYIHHDADLELAARVCTDSKVQYTAVCNAVETILVHEKIAQAFLPALKAALDKHSVRLYGCGRSAEIIPVEAAGPESWDQEYLDYKVNVKIMDSLDEAIAHINLHGSGHTDGIICKDPAAVATFFNAVDSASVINNASTRFADGFRYGLGAEVGISTGKLHARGPVGMEGLLSYKWQVYGSGQLVGDYTGAGRTRRFSHRDAPALRGLRLSADSLFAAEAADTPDAADGASD